MAKPYNTISDSVDTIVSGARLLAAAQGMDPDTMESIVRKSARVARENLMQSIRIIQANDEA